MIRFDQVNGGIFVLNDFYYNGYLCHEEIPTPAPTTINLHDMFALRPFSKPEEYIFSDTLVILKLTF